MIPDFLSLFAYFAPKKPLTRNGAMKTIALA